MSRIFIKTETVFDEYGRMIPQALIWEDGRKFDIDYVSDIKRIALPGIGRGDKYTIVIKGKKRELFFERSTNLSGNIIGRWYIES